ncbi:hypothetical protein ACTFIW_000012 [Dictyostelium discoideum]
MDHYLHVLVDQQYRGLFRFVWKDNSTTLETEDYSTFQSHEPSTLKVYSSSYTRFRNFCTSNSLNPANITLVVFMNYLTHLLKIKPPLTFSTINGHRSMLNQLLKKLIKYDFLKITPNGSKWNSSTRNF